MYIHTNLHEEIKVSGKNELVVIKRVIKNLSGLNQVSRLRVLNYLLTAPEEMFFDQETAPTTTASSAPVSDSLEGVSL